MSEIDLANGDPIWVFAAVAAGLFGIAALLYVTARRGEGFFQYFPYVILLSLAVLIAVSGRSLLLDYEAQGELLRQRSPVVNWTNHFTTLFLVMTSLERLANYIFRRGHAWSAPYPLAVMFVVFWLTTVASPAILGSHSSYSKEGVYTLLIGCTALVLTRRESDVAVTAARNSLLLFLAAGVALIPMRPALVMDASYASGLFRGLPRFAGLSPHAVSLGMLAQLFMLCLYSHPFSRSWLNRLGWVLGLLFLFLAQSKTAWISFPICAAFIYWFRGGSGGVRTFGDQRGPLTSRIAAFGVVLVIVAIGAAYMVGGLDHRIDVLLSGRVGADLTSLSGRDRVWAAALEDWARHPVFGYGTQLFDDAYRAAIQMPFATNGHNQFIDTLARSGLVGAAGLVAYLGFLLVFSCKCARSSRGLSLAIFVAIVIGSVSEVPLALVNYGPDVLQQALLLAVLAGHAAPSPQVVASNTDPGAAASGLRVPRSLRVEYDRRTGRPLWG